MKRRPLLQIALDTQTVEEALAALAPVGEYVDVIEVGTILLAAVGKSAITTIRAHYPDKIIVADGKIADAGAIFARMFYDAGADYITCICAAETETIKTCAEVGATFSSNHEVQIELTSHYTWDQVAEWQAAGIPQVVYHRARDAQLAGKNWSDADLESISRLITHGFRVTVTGGLVAEDIKLFKGLDIYIFVGGRALRDSSDPAAAARAFKEEIIKYW